VRRLLLALGCLAACAAFAAALRGAEPAADPGAPPGPTDAEPLNTESLPEAKEMP